MVPSQKFILSEKTKMDLGSPASLLNIITIFSPSGFGTMVQTAQLEINKEVTRGPRQLSVYDLNLCDEEYQNNPTCEKEYDRLHV